MTFRPHLLRTGLCLTTAILHAAASFVPHAWPLQAVSWAPFVWVYARRERVSLMPGLVGAYALGVLGLYSTALGFSIAAPFLLAPLQAIFVWPAIPLYLQWVYRRWSPPLAIAFPPILVACEYAWVNLQYNRLGGFNLGYSLAEHPLLIQAADLGGVYLLSFVLASIHGAIVDLVRFLGARGDENLRRRVRLSLLTAGILASSTLGYGLLRLDRRTPAAGPRVALIQPAILHRINTVYGVYMTQILMTVERAGGADLVVWPENSIFDFMDRPGRYLEDLGWLARKQRAPILVGAMGHGAVDPFRTTNSAFLVDDSGRVAAAYDKIDIIPWTEYLPFESFLARWAPALNLRHQEAVTAMVGYFPTGTAGTRTTLFPLTVGAESIPFAVSLCSENILPRHALEGARLGARFLINMTSEGDAGGLVQNHLMRICRLRAVETRLPYVRVGNTGISGMIDANGRTASLLKGDGTGAATDEPGVLLAAVPFLSPRGTLYVRFGDLFAQLMTLAAIATALAALLARGPAGAGAVGAITLLATALPLASCGPGAAAAPDGFEASLSRGRDAFGRKDYDAALQALVQAAESRPGDEGPYPYLAEIFRIHGLYGDGYRFFESVRAKGVTLPSVLVGDAYFQDRLWRKRQALDLYLEVLAAVPGERTASLRGITLLLDIGEARRAAAIASEGVARNPDDAELHLLRVRALLESKDLPGAGTALEAARRAGADPARAGVLAGYIALAEGREAEAERTFMQVRAIEPRDHEALYNLFRLALRRDDLTAARAALAELRRLEEEA